MEDIFLSLSLKRQEISFCHLICFFNIKLFCHPLSCINKIGLLKENITKNPINLYKEKYIDLYKKI
jgi:hypothetical protein